jgi:hypothetical protein
MTFYFQTGATSYEFSSNLTNLSGDHTLSIQSRYNKNAFEWDLTIEESNDRYTTFSLDLTSQDVEGHYNGVYNYQITDSEDNILEAGLVKWINEDGGRMNTVSYTSDNENRDATQFYRPNY